MRRVGRAASRDGRVVEESERRSRPCQMRRLVGFVADSACHEVGAGGELGVVDGGGGSSGELVAVIFRTDWSWGV